MFTNVLWTYVTPCQGTPTFEVTQAHHKWSAVYVTWSYICTMVQQKKLDVLVLKDVNYD